MISWLCSKPKSKLDAYNDWNHFWVEHPPNYMNPPIASNIFNGNVALPWPCITWLKKGCRQTLDQYSFLLLQLLSPCDGAGAPLLHLSSAMLISNSYLIVSCLIPCVAVNHPLVVLLAGFFCHANIEPEPLTEIPFFLSEDRSLVLLHFVWVLLCVKLLLPSCSRVTSSRWRWYSCH